MADISEVLDALVGVAALAIYPGGTGQASAAGVPVKIYAGWPTSAQLDPDLAAGTCHVTVFPTQIERNTSRHFGDWIEQAPPTPTLAIGQVGQVLTISGTVSTPQNVMVRVGGVVYAYAVKAGDTLTAIAAALAAMIPGASAAGAAVTLPASANITAARVGTTGTLIREIRRQERVIRLTVWADTPDHRTAIAKVVDGAFAALNFVTLPDQFAARIMYRGSPINDSAQKENLYRRDLDYAVDYATTQTAPATQITQQQIGVATTAGTPTITTTA